MSIDNTAAIAVGSVEGTGSAINVPLGFAPRYVEVFNYDDAGAVHPIVKWWSGMTDGHGLKIGTAATAIITTGGISAYAGDDSNAAGFSIGTDADLNVSAETIFYTAHR